MRSVPKRYRLAGLGLLISWIFLAIPVSTRANTPVSTVQVTRSTGPAVDVDVNSHIPGEPDAQKKSPHWFVVVLRLAQQILGGFIIF